MTSAGDMLLWIAKHRLMNARSDRITATYVVDLAGRLCLADRHSEHVACAGGEPVLAAGELVLRVVRGAVVVEEVTNQSTGYCPEPESWPAVTAALETAGIASPEGYTTEFSFRRCPRCAQINVVKDLVFECAVCGSGLPVAWNFETAADAG